MYTMVWKGVYRADGVGDDLDGEIGHGFPGDCEEK